MYNPANYPTSSITPLIEYAIPFMAAVVIAGLYVGLNVIIEKLRELDKTDFKDQNGF